MRPTHMPYFVAIAFALSTALVAASNVETQSLQLPSPEELYQRMAENARVPIESATGRYLRWVYNANKQTPDAMQAQIDATVENLKHAYSAKGAEQLQKFETQADQIKKTLLNQSTQTDWVSVDTYYILQGKYRIDRTMLSNSLSLEEHLHKQSWKDAVPEFTRTWNGVYSDLLDRVSQPAMAPPGNAHIQRLVRDSTPIKAPNFLTFGRDVPDVNLIKVVRSQNIPVSVISGPTIDGEPTLILCIGTRGSVGLDSESTILPNKGYIMSEETTKMYGATTLYEKYSDFLRTAAGFWIPKRVRTESYRLNGQGVPELAARLDLVAIEDPQVNIPLDPSLFDIQVTKDTLIDDRRNGRDISVLVPGSQTSSLGSITNPKDIDDVKITTTGGNDKYSASSPESASNDEQQVVRNNRILFSVIWTGIAFALLTIVSILRRNSRKRGAIS